MNDNAEHNGNSDYDFVECSINRGSLFTQTCACYDCKKSTSSALVMSLIALES